MKCKMSGKIVGYKVCDNGLFTSLPDSEIKMRLYGRDSMGKEISGELTLFCSANFLKDVKIQDILSIDIENKEM